MYKRIVIALIILCLLILLTPFLLWGEDSSIGVESNDTLQKYKKEQEKVHKQTELIIENINTK